jgi:hypothetical protein
MERRVLKGLLLVTLVLVAGLTVAGAAAAAPVYNLYYGDLHSHTDYSDGTGTPAQAYAAAAAADADFFGTTDHSHYPYGTVFLTAQGWAETLAIADAYNKDGEFVTMPGYERWLPWMTTGEMNIFLVPEIYGQGDNPAGNGYNNGNPGGLADFLTGLYDYVAAQGGSAQWNHPDYYGNDRSSNADWYDFGLWTPERDKGVNMIEVWNEIAYEGAYIRALDAGWHVIPSANSDTHYADWITGCDVRTVLLADGLTRAKLLGAMRASRGYGTEDKDLAIRYSLGGKVMGSTLAPAASYKASIQISDPGGAKDAVKLVEIVADGGTVVARKAFNSAGVSWSPTVSSSTARYFYLRVTTASDFEGDEGVTAWTAPVWTGR